MNTENNKLIAEFMQLPTEGEYYGINENEIYMRLWHEFSTKSIYVESEPNLEFFALKVEQLQYHVSIEKMGWCDEFRIESEQVVVKAGSNYTRLYITKYHQCHANSGIKIQAVYDACIEFIKWYNNQSLKIT